MPPLKGTRLVVVTILVLLATPAMLYMMMNKVFSIDPKSTLVILIPATILLWVVSSYSLFETERRTRLGRALSYGEGKLYWDWVVLAIYALAAGVIAWVGIVILASEKGRALGFVYVVIAAVSSLGVVKKLNVIKKHMERASKSR